MSKFLYFNDTQRMVHIHIATQIHGTTCDMSPIQPSETREFTLPEGTYPWVKMWDYGEKYGLQILVSPTRDDASDGGQPKHIGKHPIEFSFTDKVTGAKIVEYCEEAMKTPDLDETICIMLSVIHSQAKRHLENN